MRRPGSGIEDHQKSRPFQRSARPVRKNLCFGGFLQMDQSETALGAKLFLLFEHCASASNLRHAQRIERMRFRSQRQRRISNPRAKSRNAHADPP